jgi:hypothetical protein
MRSRRGEDRMRDEEDESGPCCSLLDKDPVQEISLVGKVPDMLCNFRSKIVFRCRIRCAELVVPSYSESSRREAFSTEASCCIDSDTYTTKTPVKTPICVVGQFRILLTVVSDASGCTLRRLLADTVGERFGRLFESATAANGFMVI